MITCRTFVEFLMQYIDGELPADQRANFDEHIARCPACVSYMRSYLEAVRLGKEAFSDPDAAVSEEVPEDLIQAILESRRKGA